MKKTGSVLVIGGGVAGIQSALDLAQSGFKVYLVDKSPSIGGHMARLDKTFPTNDCSMCILSPKLVEASRHLNIELLTYTQVEKIEGQVGNFKVTLKESPRYVDAEKCTGCGLCAEKCPVIVSDTYNEQLSTRKAIYLEYPQAVPNVYTIDREHCIGCRLCENVCPPKAIDFDQEEEDIHLNVGAVLLTPGCAGFDPHDKPHYGYGRFPNVVTSLEFERILNAAGPYSGHVLRPGDGKVPKKIAFVQCVGSRDRENRYCSAVCCTYAVKEALVGIEHQHDLEPTIFFMDVRTFGKGFEDYYSRAKEEGVRFIRSMIAAVEEIPGTGDLLVTYETEDGELKKEVFDMLVLSIGLIIPESTRALARRIGVEVNEFGFCESDELSPFQTNRPGVFVAGTFGAPMDIPETVAQASGAASRVEELLVDARNTLSIDKSYVGEHSSNGTPRIGVFVCHCGINIGSVVNVPEVVEYAKNLPGVAYAEDNLYTCSSDTQDRIKELIAEHDLNRVVVASCSPRTHEPLFQETIREAGLNRYLFDMANIRDQCSWVHKRTPEAATEKAKDLLRSAIAKVALLEPLDEVAVDVSSAALVVGGGASGLHAALGLAGQGFQVHLVEREQELGGQLRHLRYSMEGVDLQAYLEGLVERVETEKRIHVYTGAEIEDISGYIGNFTTDVNVKGENSPLTLEHGVVIVATGADQYQPKEYLYGKNPKVVTQVEFENMLADRTLPKTVKKVVMIQCVGSRDEERTYCSRLCCQEAVKNALRYKEDRPDGTIYILYRDMRTYGMSELKYESARDKGVTFIRYHESNKPVVTARGKGLKVKIRDILLEEDVILDADMVVLSAGVVAHDNSELAKMLKIPVGSDGFFLEAHVKLRPLDFATDGVYLCGLAHSPKTLPESVVQAMGAVSRASIPLSSGTWSVPPTVSSVDEELCIGCGLCESLCPHSAIKLELKEGGRKSVVIEASCKGCGTCGASCPVQAITMKHFTSEAILAQIDAVAGK
jgi:heterodisulfide reductase subunit A